MPNQICHSDKKGYFIGFLKPQEVEEYERTEARWNKDGEGKNFYNRDGENTKKMIVEYVVAAYAEKIKECTSYGDIKKITGSYAKGITGTCWSVLMRILKAKELKHPYVYPYIRELAKGGVTEDYLEKRDLETEINKEIRIVRKVIKGDNHSQLSLKKLKAELADLLEERARLEMPKTLGQEYFKGFTKPLYDAVDQSVWKRNDVAKKEAAAVSYRKVRDLINVGSSIDEKIALILDRRSGIDKKTANEATYYASSNRSVTRFPYQVWRTLRDVS